jgi:DNA-binding transcriptional ArsR family regulator
VAAIVNHYVKCCAGTDERGSRPALRCARRRHPRGIVERLAAGEATVTELAAPFSISLPAISRHLKVLERASLITRSQQGRWRHARLSPTSLASAATWLSRYERLWAESFDRLDDHLARLTSEQQLTSPTQTETGTETQTERGRS